MYSNSNNLELRLLLASRSLFRSVVFQLCMAARPLRVLYSFLAGILLFERNRDIDADTDIGRDR